MSRNLAQSDYRPGTPEVVAYTATHGPSAALGSGVKAVDVVCTTAAYIAIGKTAIATSSFIPVEAAKHYRYMVAEGDRVSAIRQSGDGSMFVIPLY
jgi:hypothetical protein